MTTISAAILTLSASHLSSTVAPNFMAKHTCCVTTVRRVCKNIPDFLRLLDGYRIQANVLAPSTPAVALLDRLPNWKRAYADDVAVVH
ncbi:MAG: hypothetical protein WB005_17070, partial [Pseudolabrys sp.]